MSESAQTEPVAELVEPSPRRYVAELKPDFIWPRPPASKGCFPDLVCGYHQGRYTLNEYLDGLLGHVKRGGKAVAHKEDKEMRGLPWKDAIPGSYWTGQKSPEQWHVVDVFAGAVDLLMRREGFEGFEEAEWEALRSLIGLAWQSKSDNASKFERDARARGFSLDDISTTLSPDAGNLLLVACYFRGHANIFSLVFPRLQPPPPPSETGGVSLSSFDGHSGYVLMKARLDREIKTPQKGFVVAKERFHPSIREPSAYKAETLELTTLEARFWIRLLPRKSGWTPRLVGDRAANEFRNQFRNVMFGELDLETYPQELLNRLLDVGAENELYMHVYDIINKCPTVEMARSYLERIPRDKALGERPGNSSATLLVGIVEAKPESCPYMAGSKKLRLDMMRLVLEYGLEGLDVNAIIQRPWVGDMERFNIKNEPEDYFNPLHAAAWQGNLEMVQLLVEVGGADVGFKDFLSGMDAAQLAEMRGYKKVATWLRERAGA